MKVIDSFKFEEVQGYKFGKSLSGIPKLCSHIYFIDGLLIDTGHIRMGDDILDTLKDLPVDQIFITHHHEDHSGNIKALQEHFDCPVYGSQLCSDMMKEPPSISLSQKMTWGDRPANDKIKPINGSINTAKHKFDIINVPGHARDMVVLYESDKKWLFSADLYVNSYIGYFLRDESITQQIESIKKVLALDFDVLLCGHNPQFKDGKTKLKKKLVFLESFKDNVLTVYKKGKKPEDIFKHLALKEFWVVKLISGGALSKMNMVKSVIRDHLKELNKC